MATLVAYKVKGNAAKDLANDGTGKHAHVCKETCVQPDCEEKNVIRCAMFLKIQLPWDIIHINHL